MLAVGIVVGFLAGVASMLAVAVSIMAAFIATDIDRFRAWLEAL